MHYRSFTCFSILFAALVQCAPTPPTSEQRARRGVNGPCIGYPAPAQNEKKDLCPTVIELPEPQDIPLSREHQALFPDGRTDRIGFIGRGQNGCVYGIKNDRGEYVLVAKTTIRGMRAISSEINSLQAIHEYRGMALTTLPSESLMRSFIYMDYIPGVRPEDTKEWRSKVSKDGLLTRDADKPYYQCFSYIEALNQEIIQTAVDYAKLYNVEHKDVFYGNLLVDENYVPWHGTDSGQIRLIDWGNSVFLTKSLNDVRRGVSVHLDIIHDPETICSSQPKSKSSGCAVM